MTTTPANVATQTVVPARGTVGGARDNGARSSSGGQAGDDAQGFGDVLAKLQHIDPRTAGVKSAERLPLEWQEPEPQDAATDDLLALVVVAAPEAVQPAPDQPAPPAAQPSPINAMEALAAAIAAPQQPASQPQSSAQTEQPETSGASATPPSPPDSVVPDVPAPDLAIADNADDIIARQGRVAASDPAIGAVSNRAAGVDKARQDPQPADAIEIDAAVPPKAAAAPQPVAANVRRQEVHFPPVAAAPQRVSGDGDAASDGVEAKRTDASAVDALTASFDDLGTTPAKPAQQIADHILKEVAATGSDAVERAVTVPAQHGAKSALKVLHIQLQPADLGTVTIRMELKESTLSLEVEADRSATADMLRGDQDTLSKLLRSAGYSVDLSTVRVADADRTSASQQLGQGSAQSSFQSSPQSQSGASERQQQQAHRGGASSNGEAGSQANRNDGNETTSARAGRGLYI
jgi:chemotaxis protein MotD